MRQREFYNNKFKVTLVLDKRGFMKLCEEKNKL